MPTTTPTYWGLDTEYVAAATTMLHRTAALKNGGWVAVASDGTTQQEIRLFNALGEQQARVPLFSTFTNTRPILEYEVQGTPDGGFVVVYKEGTLTADTSIFLQRFDVNGAKVGPETAIESGPEGTAYLSLDVDDQGAILIAYGRHDSATHDSVVVSTIRDGFTSSFVVAPPSTAPVVAVTIDALADGNFAVVYTQGGQFYSQVFTNDNINIQPENFINPHGVDDTVALQNGNFVVFYTDTGAELPDRSGQGVYARILGPEGEEVAGPILVNTKTAGDQAARQMVALHDGGFMAFWWEGADLASAFTRGQRFDEDGHKVGKEFIVDVTNNFGILVVGAETLADGRVLLEVAQVDPGEPSGLRTTWRMMDPRDAVIEGTNENDVITGREGDTHIAGLDGNDTLYGRLGDDTLLGGAGNDQLYGSSGADLLNGGSGKDRLDGGADGDTLIGGSGDDTYYVETDDFIIETSGNGADSVRARSSFILAEGVSIERLETSNSAGTTVINLTGNSLYNALRGNAAANILQGGGGDDVLVGGKGADTLYGGSGADKFRYESRLEGGDIIKDFVSGTDDLVFLKTEFGNISAITGTNYVENTSGLATTTAQRFILETDTGTLRYDSNGSASGGVTVVATLNVNDLSAGDFLFV